MRVAVAIALVSAGAAMAASPPRIARGLPSQEPLLEGDRLGAAEEIALDDGSAIRPWSGTDALLADYATLSTGQRVTNIRMSRGDLSLDVQTRWRDSFTVTLPGAQFQFTGPARVRLRTGDEGTILACVFTGEIIFYTPSVDLRVPGGKCLSANRNTPDRFAIEHEVDAALDWSSPRTDELAAHGTWIATETASYWKPAAPAGWTPYRNGRWRWIDRLGWTWIPVEPWGWRTTHHGRWLLNPDHGWVWTKTTAAFQPSAVFWTAGAGFLAWGPLAPGETWPSDSLPRAFAAAHLTAAEWTPSAQVLDPAGFVAPVKDLFAAIQSSPGPPPFGPATGAPPSGEGLLRFGVLMPAQREADRPPHVPPPPAQSAPVSRVTPPSAPPPELTIGPTLIVPVAFTQEVVTVPDNTTTYLAPDYKGIVVYDPIVIPEGRRKSRTR